jgi:SNF2 family DNA or RNA helicase
MTTYETLLDHSADFGAVYFAALLADEAQKVKTPGVRMTDALKGGYADFRIAMTGTPVENRLADLWCIVDGVRAGWLGDLAGFSRSYEGPTALDDLKQLKKRLDQPFGGAPPLLLRRMKEDHLPDLPKAEVHMRQASMPAGQRGVYL